MYFITSLRTIANRETNRMLVRIFGAFGVDKKVLKASTSPRMTPTDANL